MILPFCFGLVMGRMVRSRSFAIGLSMAIGALLALIAVMTFIPLLYPLFILRADVIAIPELRVYNLFIFSPQFKISEDAVNIFGPTGPISLVFLIIMSIVGIISGGIGSALGLRPRESQWSKMSE